jgi:hypothetical protein
MAAEVIRRQAIELAEQQRQIAVVQAEQQRGHAEMERLLVMAQREEADQAVKLVEATQQAQRSAKISLIEAEREAQKAMIEQKNRIELDALRKQREAEAQAKALKEMATAEAEAALKQAETVRTQAKAEAEAEKLRADGAKARASAIGLAEAEVSKAKAEAGLREAEAIRAQGLAQAESDKAKAEALAAFDGVAQRVEVIKLQLDAQVRIEVAKAQALGSAMASMNIKLIGDPNAAASLLRMVNFADGIGEVIQAAPKPAREIVQQLVNSVTGNPSGGALMGGGGDSGSLTELAEMVPELVRLTEKTIDVNKLKGKSVGETLSLLREQVNDAERPTIAKAQQALAFLPILNDLPFEDFYLRAAR